MLAGIALVALSMVVMLRVTDLPLILWTPDQAAWRSACSGVIYPRAECSR
jgi:hypothetical protein